MFIFKQNDKDGIDPTKHVTDLSEQIWLKWLSWWSEKSRIGFIVWFSSNASSRAGHAGRVTLP